MLQEYPLSDEEKAAKMLQSMFNYEGGYGMLSYTSYEGSTYVSEGTLKQSLADGTLTPVAIHYYLIEDNAKYACEATYENFVAYGKDKSKASTYCDISSISAMFYDSSTWTMTKTNSYGITIPSTAYLLPNPSSVRNSSYILVLDTFEDGSFSGIYVNVTTEGTIDSFSRPYYWVPYDIAD